LSSPLGAPFPPLSEIGGRDRANGDRRPQVMQAAPNAWTDKARPAWVARRAVRAKDFGPMRIATWNVNSVNARLETVLAWFRDAQPDVACLQEIKCVDEKFPAEAFESLGYNVAVHGQKAYNGVAMLSKFPLEDVRKGLPDGDGDDHARYIEAVIAAPKPVRVGGLYLPNGNPVGTEKFAYKLAWMDRLHRHAADLLTLEEPFVLCGDYNVIPEPEDCDNPPSWMGDALFQPESRAAFRGLKWLGLTDAHAAVGADPHAYTFWDYQAGAWPRNHGIRIDHALLSPQAADRLLSSEIHRDVRAMDKPSDHVPLVVTLEV
jgi:exodeoxyribonuclease-3